jgi:periplasmic protein TonB
LRKRCIVKLNFKKMLASKFDLYKSEWLELVFDDRNKAYGAYDLRKYYAQTLFKAVAITSLSVIGLFVGVDIMLLHRDHTTTIETLYNPTIPVQPPTVKPPVTPPRAQETHPQTNTSSIKYPRMVVTVDNQATNPPTIPDLKTEAIGSVTKKGTDESTDLNTLIEGPPQGPATAVIEDNTPVDMHTVEVEPEPLGGAAAWAKFLQRNVRYPGAAQDAGVGGRVWLSFIVEKDGHLSNITVERGAGYGMDEEAVRVLKLAPAWKPGIQNGHAVRVKYNLPFNFQLPPSE